MNSGLFISFEGIEGAGKTTHISLLKRFLQRKNYDVHVTREPGGTPAAEAARHVLLSCGVDEFGAEAEAIVFAAARLDHVENVIRPALMEGKILLCDRFLDSSYAYQGERDSSQHLFLDSLQEISVQEVMPDCTIILDLPVDIGLKRVQNRYSLRESACLDYFERKDVMIHEKRRQIFLDIARNQPDRCHIVDSAHSFQSVATNILNIVWELVQKRVSPLSSKKDI
ncbi:dTMP kinase [Candidatus Liberibacter asiaticus]|uniref:Thymidylate kinase n=2 Tax=Liberibacter asiaticus TaxID=34021 RepID=C6XHE8_LIBAP|nr:dTMP kinase [Candidatus Liberibacter asiaticus]ACT56691.1 thymidylate kinase [Candidatus Liberibacter asiaticus str. psy62]AGH16458.1 thymidylate kinase [Candidatus Liberibacter asiaticus str. gxpsy]ALK06864.1 dTMP kinase [Candidatus Liberibacter asiaticus]ASK52334.1 dTMP kinase [Candidatus Liberibacter asiaticus]AWL13657.1 dTMP kinase [Candidatus Liberibacter asiaticus]